MNGSNELFLRLTTNIIFDYLKNYAKIKKKIIFDESKSLGYRSIRFSTPMLDNEFKPVKSKIGAFKDGHFVYFEIKVMNNFWILYLNFSKIGLSERLKTKLSNISSNSVCENEDTITMYKKILLDINSVPNDLINCLNDFFENDLENILLNVFNNKNHDLPNVQNNDFVDSNDDKVTNYYEGNYKAVISNKYERNKRAREKCIEHYGAVCQICGFDFTKQYGERFKRIIEVHHIVPLYKIKKEYIIDPIKDLIPVCCNCHMIIHSKNDGEFSVDEVKSFLKNEV